MAAVVRQREVVSRIRKLHYIYAEDDYLVGIYVVNTDKNNNILSDTMYYVHQDRLSSYDMVALPNGEVKEKLGYDVWGNRVLWDDWSEKEALVTEHLFHRGYTQHEHLNGFGIINMNGRLYDPNIASFFSPDPFVAGMWSGGAMANGTINPFKWDYSSGKTWSYMFDVAVVGGVLF